MGGTGFSCGVALALALVATPARADPLRPFGGISGAFGVAEVGTVFDEAVDTGIPGHPVHRTAGGNEDGLSEGAAVALGVARSDGWVFGGRVDALEIPRFFSGSPAFVGLSFDAFARWYAARNQDGPWLEACLGVEHFHFDLAPANAWGIESLWGPGGSAAYGYAIRAGRHIEWGPELRLSAAYTLADRGHGGMAGLTIGLGAAWL